jgi:hypothetical protein
MSKHSGSMQYEYFSGSKAIGMLTGRGKWFADLNLDDKGHLIAKLSYKDHTREKFTKIVDKGLWQDEFPGKTKAREWAKEEIARMVPYDYSIKRLD